MNAHQVNAALFTLAFPISRGMILADEAGRGTTIEANLIIAQHWAEHRRRILLIVPASLRKQWLQRLQDKFSLPSIIIEAKSYQERVKAGRCAPLDTIDWIGIHEGGRRDGHPSYAGRNRRRRPLPPRGDERNWTSQREIEDVLDQVQASMAIASTTEPAFTIGWEVA